MASNHDHQYFQRKAIPRELLLPPDGGFGWVIVMASFFITCISFGIISSIGMTFDLLMEEFDCSTCEVSLVASIAFGLERLLTAFITIPLKRLTIRSVVVIGASTVAVGLALSAFAPKLYFLYFSFGVLGGTGLSLMYSPYMMLLSLYFHRRRALATALASFGAFVGWFAVPYLYRLLLTTYGWRGTLLILAALELNSVAFGLLLRPVEERVELPPKIKNDGEKASKNADKVDHSPNSEYLRLQAFIEDNITGVTHQIPTNKHDVREQAMDSHFNFAKNHYCRSNSLVSKPPVRLSPSVKLKHSHESSLTSLEHSGRNLKLTKRQLSEQIYDRNVNHRVVQPHGDNSLDDSKAFFATTLHLNRNSCPIDMSSFANVYDHGATVVPGIGIGKESLAGHASSSLDDQQPESADFKEHTSPREPAMIENIEVDVDSTVAELGSGPLSLADYKPTICTVYGNYLKNSKFVAFLALCFLKGAVFYLPSIFIVTWGRSLNLSNLQTTVLLSALGIGNIIGRPVAAYFSDLFANYRVYMAALMFGIPGIVTVCTVFLPVFSYLLAFTLSFSFFVGSQQIFVMPFLADIFPATELATAFNIVNFAEGIGALIVPPFLAMILPDLALVFVFAGILLLSLCVHLILIVLVEKCC